VKDFAQFMDEIHIQYGFNKLQIGVLSAIMIAPSALTQDELMEYFQESRSSISTCLNTLIRTQMIHIQKRPSDRRKYYVTPLNFENYLTQFIEKVIESYTINLNWIEELIQITKNKTFNSTIEQFSYFLQYFYFLHKLFLNYLYKYPEFMTKLNKQANYTQLDELQQSELCNQIKILQHNMQN